MYFWDRTCSTVSVGRASCRSFSKGESSTFGVGDREDVAGAGVSHLRFGYSATDQQGREETEGAHIDAPGLQNRSRSLGAEGEVRKQYESTWHLRRKPTASATHKPA